MTDEPNKPIDRREAKREYVESAKPMGVFRVRCVTCGYTYLGSSPDLPSMLNRVRFQLELGSFPDRALQADWNEHGPDAFEFEIVDTIEPRDEPGWSPKDDLAELLAMWRERESGDADA